MSSTVDFLVVRNGRLYCSLCDLVLPSSNEKAIKQHKKSITHKRASATSTSASAATSDTTSPNTSTDPEDETASAALELSAELGLKPPAEAVAITRYAEYASNRTAWRALYAASELTSESWLLPPPVMRNPKRECPRLDKPFVTIQCGSLPLYPDSLEEALGSYFTGRRDAHPKVDVNEAGKESCSWADARRTLLEADGSGQRYWCTFFCAEMGHPQWWPKLAKGSDGLGEGSGSVPLFDQVIIGRGRTGIGIHADSYTAGASKGESYLGTAHHKTLVSTCLTIVRGRKRVMLLPPACGEGGAECSWFGDADTFPLEPSLELLERIAAVGGYLFSIVPLSEREDEGVSLFTPAGWFHWLLGDGSSDCSDLEDKATGDDWHVIFGGSFFPKRAHQLGQS
jgi:hypothetical protein